MISVSPCLQAVFGFIGTLIQIIKLLWLNMRYITQARFVFSMIMSKKQNRGNKIYYYPITSLQIKHYKLLWLAWGYSFVTMGKWIDTNRALQPRLCHTVLSILSNWNLLFQISGGTGTPLLYSQYLFAQDTLYRIYRTEIYNNLFPNNSNIIYIQKFK